MSQAHLNPPFRADHVGSLVRPQKLLETRQAYADGKVPAEALHALEDAAIRDVVALQERVGLSSITDGEFRRNNWRDRFFERTDGYSEDKMPSSFIFTEFSGETRRGMPVQYAVDKLQRRDPITADDFAVLQKLTKRMAKATIPSPTVNHFFTGDKALENSPYAGDRQDLSGRHRRDLSPGRWPRSPSSAANISKSTKCRSRCFAIPRTKTSSGRAAKTRRS